MFALVSLVKLFPSVCHIIPAYVLELDLNVIVELGTKLALYSRILMLYVAK